MSRRDHFSSPRMDRQIAQMIRAADQAAEVLEAERIAWLARLTRDEARMLFEQLYQVWAQGGRRAGGDWEALERWRIETKLAVRQAFERLFSQRGLR